MYDREERRCCFFVSGCDSAPLLEASPEVLNEMLAPIGPFWADDRPIASFCGNGGKVVEHGWCQGQFMGQSKTEGFSMSVRDHADFRAIAAARAAKCLTMVLLFERGPFWGAPAALW